MSTTTASNFVASPVTPDTLVDLLKQARAYLHDAPRSGQVLGMRIDEALDRWSQSTFGVFNVVQKFNDIEIHEIQNMQPGQIVAFSPKPVTFKDIPWAGEGTLATGG